MLLIAGMAVSAIGQSAYTPGKGSAERKAIMDALRVPVERELKQKVVFVVDHIKVQGSWAFVNGSPQSPSGGQPDYRKTEYWDAVESDAFDNNYFALLRKTRGKWQVSTYAIGCTDVCYWGWWDEYKAPKAIFPYSE